MCKVVQNLCFKLVPNTCFKSPALKYTFYIAYQSLREFANVPKEICKFSHTT